MLRSIGVLITCIGLLHVTSGQGVNPSECRSLIELCFVIDGSDSIFYDEFIQLKQSLLRIIPELNIGPQMARVGMLVYSTYVDQIHPFSDNPLQIDANINSLIQPQEGTQTGRGIESMIQMFQQYGRPNVPWVAIVLTDGTSKNQTKTSEQASIAASMGVNMFAVGIGSKVNPTELQTIASSPQQVITIDNFNLLATLLSNLMLTICPCPIPPVVPYGKCNDGPRSIGSQRTYSCDHGYLLVGNPSITCRSDSTWTPLDLDFACVPCSDNTPPVQHGYCPGGTGPYIIGAQRTYQCEENFLLVGDPIINCQADATWSKPTVKCVACAEPKPPAFATVSIGTNAVGSKRFLDCHADFKAMGNTAIECFYDQNVGEAYWLVDQTFQCAACPEPDINKLPMFATFPAGPSTIGATRTLSCGPDYRQVGSPTIRCVRGADNVFPYWEISTDFACQPCGEPIIPANTICLGKDITLGSQRTFQCKDGYKLIGNPTITCSDDFMNGPGWQIDSTFQCASCGDPTQYLPKFSKCSSGLDIVGATRTISCGDYFLDGLDTITCMAGDHGVLPYWDIKATCKACGEPIIPEYAFCDGTAVTIGSTRTMGCQTGYKIIGDPTITCSASFANGPGWVIDKTFQCASCGDPTQYLPAFSTCSSGLDTLGATRTISCGDYFLDGSDTITCMPGGPGALPYWEIKATCKPCGEPIVPAYAVSLGTGVTVGATRTLACQDGYKLIGDPTITCVNSFVGGPDWSIDKHFQCVTCEEPMPHLLPEFSQCSSGLNLIGSKRTISCGTEYRLVGLQEITCMPGAPGALPYWQIDTLCKPCGEPKMPINAVCHGDAVTIGSTRTLDCMTGYRAVGLSTIECVDNINWPGPEWVISDTFQCAACGEIPTIPHANCSAGEHKIGAIRQYNCMGDYHLVGSPNIECLDDLSHPTPIWGPANFKCVICSSPPYIPNAYSNDGPLSVGTSRMYFCNEPYTTRGYGEFICSEDGTWVGDETFRCIAPVTTTPMPTSPDPTMCDQCRYENGVGYNFHPMDCNQYVQCYIGTRGLEPVYRRCPFGLHWDQNALTCNYPNVANNPYDICSIQPGLVSYKHTDPNICCAYWECQDGVSTAKCCPDGQSYNPNVNQCVPDPDCYSTCPFKDEMPACDLKPTEGDRTTYQQHIGNGYWVTMPCAPGSLFDEVACNCAHTATTTVPIGPIAPVCRPVLHLPLNNITGFRDISNNNAQVENDGVYFINGAAYFDGKSSLRVNFFSNYFYDGPVVIKLRYFEDPSSPHLEALITNGDCEDDPSIIIAKMPRNVLLGARAETPVSFAVAQGCSPDDPYWPEACTPRWQNIFFHKDFEKLSGALDEGYDYRYAYGDIEKTHCAIHIGKGTHLANYRGIIADVEMYVGCNPYDPIYQQHDPMGSLIV